MYTNPAAFGPVPNSTGSAPGHLPPPRVPATAGKVVVQKFGGSSVADPEAVKRVARRIMDTRAAGHQVVTVVSAMGDTTDELLDLAASVTSSPKARELDLLLTSGEHISAALLALALSDLGAVARTFTGANTGLITDEVHGKAHVVDVDARRIRSSLNRGEIPIVAGFQGRGMRTREVTTLGRGGSDITAIALASALDAGVCEIYTDVDGVFTADPRVVPSARKIDTISSEGMLELAACGSKILHVRCVEYARRFGVTLHVRSSFTPNDGTWVVPGPASSPADRSGTPLENAIVSDITAERSAVKIIVRGVSDVPEAVARLFEIAGRARTKVDTIVQHTEAEASGLADIAFTAAEQDSRRILSELDRARAEIGFQSLDYDDRIGLLCLAGHGMRNDPEACARFFNALSASGINIDMISTSGSRISVAVAEDLLAAAAAAVSRAFATGGTRPQMLAPVASAPERILERVATAR